MILQYVVVKTGSKIVCERNLPSRGGKIEEKGDGEPVAL